PGSGGEVEGTIHLRIPAANQANPLFRGITLDGDSVQIFKTGAADNGDDSRTKGLNYATDVAISAANTLLASGINDPANATVCVNDIPAGTTVGSEVLQARMITVGMNFGAICKDAASNLTSAGLTLWRNAVYVLAGREVPSWPAVIPKKVAYLNDAAKVMAPTAAPVDNDPIIQLLNNDPNIDLEVLLVAADAVVDVTGYAAVIVQEGFNSSAAIIKPGGSLGMANIPVPFLLNKTYTMRSGRGFAADTPGSGGEIEGTLYLRIPEANRANPLFKGITLVGDSVQILKTGAADNGDDTRTKGLNYATDVVITAENTLLASGINDPANATVCVNDIPAGATIGSEVLQARMITVGMNFGAICKDGGNNLTSAGLTLWRNAVYSLVGFDIPDTPVVASTEATGMTASAGVATFNNTAKAFQLVLPAGTHSATLSVTTADPYATVTLPEINVADGATETYDIVVTASIGGAQDVYTLDVHTQKAGEILYLSADSKGTYKGAKKFDTNVYDMLVAAGYSVTFAKKGSIVETTAPFDYAPYAGMVVSAGESSSNVNDFAKRNYPIPCVSMQNDGPKNNKWGWANDKKAAEFILVKGAGKYDVETAKIKITNNQHPITQGYSVDQLITWSLGTPDSADWAGKEIKSYNLNDSIPEAIPLATIPADGSLLSTMWAVPAGTSVRSLQSDNTYARANMTSNVVLLYLFNDGLLYAAPDFGTLLTNSLDWAINGTAGPAKKEIVFVKTNANQNDSIVIANIANYADGTAYNVTVIEQGVITEDLLPQFNAADLVIMGRSIASGDVATGMAVWDQITAPVLSMNMWGMRSSRAKWTPSASCENLKQADDVYFQGVIVATDDPVFKGITTEPFDWWWGNYSDFAVDAEGDDAGNGTLLAQTPDGKMLFARWEAGVEFYPGSGTIPQGERVYIGSGSDDGGVIAYFNWSETSALIFWRELARLTGYEIPATIKDKTVIFVTDDNEDNEQIEWLASKGLTVTKYYPAAGLAAAPQAEKDALNAADLVIVGRSPGSTDFQSAENVAAWNAITAPCIYNSQWVVRNSRLKMFNSGSAVHQDTPDIAGATIVDASDPAFSFVEVTDGKLDWCIKPHDYITSVTETNGTVLAWLDSDPTAPLFARFEAGVEYYPGSVEMPAGPRTYFGFGNDANGFSNFFPLTDNARKVYWAEILNILGLPIEEEIVNPDPYAILDPAYLKAEDLLPGMSIVEMGGKKYLQVVLDGWNSTLSIPAFTLQPGWTATCDFKYVKGATTTAELNQINAVVQIMDNVNKIPNPWGGTDPVPSSTGIIQSPATGAFKFVKAAVSDQMKIVDMVQFFGQETVTWGPTTGDTIWVGKVRALPIDPNVIVDPATFDPDNLNAGWEVVDISNTKYFKVALDSWNSWLGIPEYTFPEGTTGFKCMAKYEAGTSGYTVDQVNTFLKFSDPGWAEIAAAGSASSATFKEYIVNIADASKHAGIFQVAGQETTGWSAVAGDFLYISKVEAVVPVQKATITFVIDDTKHKMYNGFYIRGSWVTATGEYDNTWSGGANHGELTDANGDNVWEYVVELVPDEGAHTWAWGFLDLNNTWLVTGSDPTFTVPNSNPQTITYVVGGTDAESFASGLNIYPNPVHNMLTITGVDIQSVKVFNLQGREVLSEQNTTGTLDVSSLKNGAYFIQIDGMNNQRTVRKFMKN
ncbi:MAG TPA: T9SS type A sorting domain-containing protein, partial [Prolixibacteraceae bacterium]|nr:T9SS type A sorting domain-containing protein [Prolixibacteraceae bacterium]